MKSILTLLAVGLIPHLAEASAVKSDSLVASARVAEVVSHRVVHGETLYSLLRQFECSRQQFDALNPSMKGTNLIKTNQVLKFPAPATPVQTTSSAVLSERKLAERKIEVPSKNEEIIVPEVSKEEAKPETSRITTIHTVAENETLYSICKKYNADIDEVKRVNNLSSNEISIGLALKIRRNSDDIKTGFPENLMIEKKPSRIIVPEGHLAKKVDELGVAELIPSKKTNDQMLALHKTAPLGSLMLVKNRATGRQVTVKVIGKLPDTGNNENVLVRLSPAAFYKLNPKDIKFSAEVTYYLPPDQL